MPYVVHPVGLLAMLGLSVVPLVARRRRRVALPPPAPAVPEPPPPDPPAPACQGTFVLPATVPHDIALRAREILFTDAPLGQELVEVHDGQTWKFVVETHGPSDQIPFPHRGVGVRVCAG